MRTMAWLAACGLIAAGAGAETDAERIARLEGEVRELRRIVGELQASLPATATSATPVPPAEVETAAPSLRLGGFAHVQYDLASTRAAGRRRTTNHFTTGGLDLFITSQLGERWSFLSENLIEFEEDGGNHIEVERALLKFEAADWLHASAGRGHLPIGFWNQRFHHGSFLQTTVERPAVLAFEDDGGLLPIHYVGLELGGDVPLGAGWVRYALNVANGRGRDRAVVQLVDDRNDGKLASLGLTWYPTGDENVGVGANVLWDRVPAHAAAGRPRGMDETIAGVHAFYLQPPWELLAEGFFVGHEEAAAGIDLEHFGGYGQLGVSIGRLRPYYRFDFLRIEGGDPYFGAAIGDLTEHTVGVRLELNKFIAPKLEYRRVERDCREDDEAAAQISFAF